MVSLLVTVFIIQLISHIILTIGSKPINDLLWQISCRLPYATSKDIQDQIRLRRDVVRLKRELAGISAQDDFARWAKLRRQHDKAMEEHDKKGEIVSSKRASFDSKATMIRWACTSGLSLGLQIWYWKTPLWTYPREWFPWFIEWLLALPWCPSGGVGITVWGFACSTVIALVGRLILSPFQTTKNLKNKPAQKQPPVKI